MNASELTGTWTLLRFWFTDEDGEANGVFTPTLQGEADDAWIAYLVAEK